MELLKVVSGWVICSGYRAFYLGLYNITIGEHLFIDEILGLLTLLGDSLFRQIYIISLHDISPIHHTRGSQSALVMDTPKTPINRDHEGLERGT